MADVITRLKVDASNYDAGLAKAKRGLEQFAQQNTTVNGIMSQGISMLTKFAGGFAAVEVATKAFNAVIMEGSQTTGDFVRNGVGALNDTMGMLAQSIATCNWNAFNQGIVSAYRNSRALREELDALADMGRAIGYANSKANTQLAEAMEVVKDPSSSASQIAEGINAGNEAMQRLKETTSAYAEEQRKAGLSILSTKSGIKDVTEDMVDALLELQMHPEAVKDSLEEYKKIAATMPGRNNYIYTQGAGAMSGPAINGFDEKAYSSALNKWLEDDKNVFAQVAATFLELSDDMQKQIISYFQNAEQQEANVARAARSWNRMLSSSTRGMSTAGNSGVAAPERAGAGVTANLEGIRADNVSVNLFRDQTESLEELQTRLTTYQRQLREVTNISDFTNVTRSIEEVQRQIEVQPMALRLGVSTESMVGIQEKIEAMWGEILNSLNLEPLPITIDEKTVQRGSKGLKKEAGDNRDAWQQAAASVAALGSALQNVDNKGVNIAGIVGQAIANIALSLSMALSSPVNTIGGVFSWIAAAAAGTATMITTIASIKNVTAGSYAEGGIVPGSYNGGIDNTYVYASPGEVILNRAQQQNLLSQLDSPTGYTGKSYVTGDQLITVINNTGRRRGRGEILFG